MKGLVNLRLQPKQSELLRLCEGSGPTWLGYGGARGGGKSAAARRVMLIRRITNPGTWGMIFRRVYDDVKRNHIDKFFEEYPQLREHYSVSDHTITIKTEGEDSKIVFGYAETEDEVKRKFHGPEYMDIFVDQAEQLSENSLQIIKTANRCPGVSDNACKLVLFFNPGGQGIAFLKRVFKDFKYHEREKAEDYAFIQAYGWDNVEWVREALSEDGLTERDFYSWDDDQRFQYFVTRSQYGRTLDALPHALRIGNLFGNFDKFAGQYFTNFDRARHVISLDALRIIRPWWSRWCSIDWGFAHHTAALWHARGTVTPEEAKAVLGREWTSSKDVTITYREYVRNELAERALGEEILSRCGQEERESIRRVFLSPDAFAKRTSQNTVAEGISDVLRQGGLPRVEMADNDRVGGWRLMYNLLESEEWLIAEGCVELVNALPLLVRDEKNLEDVLKTATLPDDVADGARYGLKSMLSPRNKPREVLREEYIAEMTRGVPPHNLATVYTRTYMADLAFKEKQKKNRSFRLR